MIAKTQHRWWRYALPAAGALVVVLALLERGTPDGRAIEGAAAPSEAAARTYSWRALHRWMASTHGAPKQPRDQAATRSDDATTPRRLAELDRTPDEDQLLWAAEEELVASCMRKRGFSYAPSPKDDDPEAEPGHRRVDHFGDVEAARATGYGLAKKLQEGETPHPTIDRNAEALARMTPQERAAFLEALRGPSISPADPSVRSLVESVPLPGGGSAYWYRDSCLAQARHRLYGQDYEHNEIGYGQSILRNEVLTRSAEDPAYKQSLDAWRGCMRARGFEDDQPGSAAKRLAGKYHTGLLSIAELRVQEVAAATADAECFVAADVGRARSDAESRAENHLLAQNSDKLLAMKSAREEALENAATALGDSDL
jgi:hypothetical protein